MPSIGDRGEGNERGPRNGVNVTDVMALLEAAELPRDDPQVAAAHTVLLARLPLTRMVELAGHTREGAAPLRLEGRGGALALEQRDGLCSWVHPPTPEQRQGQSGRVALLAGLREAGVAPLAMRQVIATALFKARREARLSPSDAERALPVSSGSTRPLAAEVGAGCAPPSPLRFHPTSDLHARGGRDEATGGWQGSEQEELGPPLPAVRRRVLLQNGEVVGVQGALGEGGSGEGGPEVEAGEEEAHEPSAAEEAWEEGPPSASSSLYSPLSRGRTSPPPAVASLPTAATGTDRPRHRGHPHATVASDTAAARPALTNGSANGIARLKAPPPRPPPSAPPPDLLRGGRSRACDPPPSSKPSSPPSSLPSSPPSSASRREFDLLLYGAYGFTGRLVAEAAARRGWRLLLCGRDRAKLAEVARIVTDAAAAAACEQGRAAAEGAVALSCFSLRDTQALHGALRRAECVLHLAGPYEETASAVASGAVLARTHYVDVSGEWRSVRTVQALGDRAAASGVMLLPAAGFDSVPTDALAARLKLRWAAATAVVVGVLPVRGALSRGTARVLLRARRAEETPLALVGGEVQPCSGVGPSLDFGAPHGALPTAVTALPDLITASLLPSRAGEPRVSSLLITQAGWFAAARPHEVEPLLERFAAASATGPDKRVRMAAAAVCSGEARDAAGGLLGRGLLRVPDPYDTTVLCVVEIASRVLSGSAPPGFQSPSSAFGDTLLDAALGDRCQWTFSDR